MTGECFLCHRYGTVQKHHIFGGACRDKSEKYKLTVNLCVDCHTGSQGVHNNAEKMLKLHQYGQRKAMKENGWSKDEFRAVFYKNYL